MSQGEKGRIFFWKRGPTVPSLSEDVGESVIDPIWKLVESVVAA
jgi:hypothetical protein